MDKKAKKRLEVLRQRLQKLQLQLTGAKQQMDDPDELTRIQNELESVRTEITALKGS